MLCHVFWSQVEYKIVCFIYTYVYDQNFYGGGGGGGKAGVVDGEGVAVKDA